MFKLDHAIFKSCLDFCRTIGEGFGFGLKEGIFINFTLIAGTVLIAISKVENKKC